MRVSETVVTDLIHKTAGFSFAYLKELFLSSMMEWMAKGRGAMDEIILRQVNQLSEQMKVGNSSVAVSQE